MTLTHRRRTAVDGGVRLVTGLRDRDQLALRRLLLQAPLLVPVEIPIITSSLHLIPT